MSMPDYLISGEPARLIPVASDGNREMRAASILLATLMTVPAFAQVMLASLGQRVGTRASISCYTEVVLRGNGDSAKLRPDGLMILDGGRGRSWPCLIETKIGRAELDPDQVLKYIGIAKSNGIPNILTISNHFVALPTHSPVRIAKNVRRGVTLYHWSWMYLLTQAMLLLNDHDFQRPEQRYILAEMVRYFTHPSIGVSAFDRMNPEWKDLVAKIQSGASLSKSSAMVENSIAAWHQEVRDLCLLMTRKLSRPVRLRLSRAHSDDPILRMKDDSEHLIKHHELRCALEIPDAAGPLVIVADLQRRSLAVSMTLAAPRDKRRTSSRINWILRQLTKANPEGLHIRALWPGRAPPTQASLAALRETPSILEAENKALLPTQFEVILVRDLAGKFAGSKTFIEQVEDAVPRFYEQAGQHLRDYVAPPPRLRKESEDEDEPQPLASVADGAESASSEAADDLAGLTTAPEARAK